MRFHPEIVVDYESVLSDERIQVALRTVRKRLHYTDCRVPVTTEMVHDFSIQWDGHLSLINALAMKAMSWTAITAMLRLGEYILSDSRLEHFPLQVHNIKVLDEGLQIRFEGWKLSNEICTMLYPWIEGTKEVAYAAIRNYQKVRETIQTNSTLFFVTKKGTPFDRKIYEAFFNFAVDHSKFAGLNISSHSFRIGGATIRHCEGVEIREIMRLGRWKCDTVNTYLRPELLLAPEILLDYPEYRCKRGSRNHYFCDLTCGTSSILEEQVKKRPQVKRKHREVVPVHKLSDEDKIEMHYTRIFKKKGGAKSDEDAPKHIAQVKRLEVSKFEAEPYVSRTDIDEDFIEKNFDGNKFWFTLTVYLAYQRIKNYKMQRTVVLKRNGVKVQLNHFTNESGTVWMPNTKYYIESEKVEAKKILGEYKTWQLNLSKAKGKVKPFKSKKNVIPRCIEISPVAFEASIKYKTTRKMSKKDALANLVL